MADKIYTTLNQRDFSGGYNAWDMTVNLSTSHAATGSKNMYLRRHARGRKGFTKFTGNPIPGGASADSMMQFCKGDFAENHLLYSATDKKVYRHPDNPPGVSAGTPVPIWATGNASNKPASFSSFGDFCVFATGADRPQVFMGSSVHARSVLRYSSATAGYTEYSFAMHDDNASTSIVLDSLGAADCIYAGFVLPFNRLVADIKTANANAAAMIVQYWNGTAWTGFAGAPPISDATSTGGISLGHTGRWNVDFNNDWWSADGAPAGALLGSWEPRMINGINLYWVKISFSAALSATVRLNAIECSVGNHRTESVNGVSGVTAMTQWLRPLWNGQYIRLSGCYKYIAATTSYEDNLSNVRDDTESLAISLASLTTTDAVYIGLPYKAKAFKFYVQDLGWNTAVSNMQISLYDGGWSANLVEFDDTSVGGKTLSQTGIVRLKNTGGVKLSDAKLYSLRDEEARMHWYKVTFSAALSAATALYHIKAVPLMEDIQPYRHSAVFKNRLFLANTPDQPNKILFTGRNNITDCTGQSSDSGFIYVDGKEPITAMASFYNELLVFKANAIYILEGYSPLTFNWLKITDDAGTIAPQSVKEIPLKSLDATGVEDHRMTVSFAYKDGMYLFDGRGINKISQNIQPHWDAIDPTHADKISVGKLHSENSLFVSIPETGVTGYVAGQCNRVYAFDYGLKTWHAPFELARGTFLEYALGSGGGYALYGAGHDGNIYLENDGHTDDGSLFGQVMVTPDFAELSTTFATKMLWLVLRAQSGGSARVYCSYDGGEYVPVGKIYQSSSRQRYRMEKITLRSDANMVSFKVESVDQNMLELGGITWSFEPLDQGWPAFFAGLFGMK